MSLSTNDEIQNFGVFVRDTITRKRTEIALWTNLNPLDWKAPRGRLVAVELPEGAYEVFSWETYGIGAGRQFSIPFKIVAGRASYIGNVYIEILTEENIFRVVVSDESKRDLALMLQRYTNIKAMDVIIEGIKWGQLAKSIQMTEDVKSNGLRR